MSNETKKQIGFNELYEMQSEAFFELIMKTDQSWRQQWADSGFAQQNATTEKEYNNLNQTLLFKRAVAENKSDPRWITFKQAQDNNYKIRKGAKGSQIFRLVTDYERIKRDENKKPILDENGKEEMEIVRYDRPRIKLFTVFNAMDIDGIEPFKKAEIPEEHKLLLQQENYKNAEIMIKNFCEKHDVNLQEIASTQAFHQSSISLNGAVDKKVVLPLKSQFNNLDDYFSVLFHEVGHSTKHLGIRVNKETDTPFGNKFGSKNYAKEELTAELTALMLCKQFGIDSSHSANREENSLAYLKVWITKGLLNKEDFKVATIEANRASKAIFEHAPKMELSLKNLLQDNAKEITTNNQAENLNKKNKENIKKNEFVDFERDIYNVLNNNINIDNTENILKKLNSDNGNEYREFGNKITSNKANLAETISAFYLKQYNSILNDMNDPKHLRIGIDNAVKTSYASLNHIELNAVIAEKIESYGKAGVISKEESRELFNILNSKVKKNNETQKLFSKNNQNIYWKQEEINQTIKWANERNFNISFEKVNDNVNLLVLSSEYHNIRKPFALVNENTKNTQYISIDKKGGIDVSIEPKILRSIGDTRNELLNKHNFASYNYTLTNINNKFIGEFDQLYYYNNDDFLFSPMKKIKDDITSAKNEYEENKLNQGLNNKGRDIIGKLHGKDNWVTINNNTGAYREYEYENQKNAGNICEMLYVRLTNNNHIEFTPETSPVKLPETIDLSKIDEKTALNTILQSTKDWKSAMQNYEQNLSFLVDLGKEFGLDTDLRSYKQIENNTTIFKREASFAIDKNDSYLELPFTASTNKNGLIGIFIDNGTERIAFNQLTKDENQTRLDFANIILQSKFGNGVTVEFENPNRQIEFAKYVLEKTTDKFEEHGEIQKYENLFKQKLQNTLEISDIFENKDYSNKENRTRIAEIVAKSENPIELKAVVMSNLEKQFKDDKITEKQLIKFSKEYNTDFTKAEAKQIKLTAKAESKSVKQGSLKI